MRAPLVAFSLPWQLPAPRGCRAQGLSCLSTWQWCQEVVVAVFLATLTLLPRKIHSAAFPRWTRAHELLSQQKIQQGDIAQIVRESGVMLR